MVNGISLLEYFFPCFSRKAHEEEAVEGPSLTAHIWGKCPGSLVFDTVGTSLPQLGGSLATEGHPQRGLLTVKGHSCPDTAVIGLVTAHLTVLCVCARMCGGQKITLGFVPQVLATFFFFFF